MGDLSMIDMILLPLTRAVLTARGPMTLDRFCLGFGASVILIWEG